MLKIFSKKFIEYEEHVNMINQLNDEIYNIKQELYTWKNAALTHAGEREKLERSIREENKRYVEKDIEVEKLKEELENIKRLQSDDFSRLNNEEYSYYDSRDKMIIRNR